MTPGLSGCGGVTQRRVTEEGDSFVLTGYCYFFRHYTVAAVAFLVFLVRGYARSVMLSGVLCSDARCICQFFYRKYRDTVLRALLAGVLFVPIKL